MKMQSSIEFLSTYGFLFIVLAIMIAAIIFIASSTQSNFNAQCAGFGGFSCNYAYDYTNVTDAYSVATVSLSNSQSVPLIITGFNLTIGSTTVNGLCTPTFVYPGGTDVCSAAFSGITVPGTAEKGYYSLSAEYCNGGLSSLPQGSCTAQTVYSGAFLVESSLTSGVVFGVDVAMGSNSANPPSYASITPMYLPANYLLVQNGEWDVNGTAGDVLYSYGTSSYLGANYVGISTAAFPPSTTLLSDVSSCTSNTPLISSAFSTIYVYSTDNLIKIESSNAMAVYYIPKGSSSWSGIFGSSSWQTTGLNEYTSNIALGNGLYGIDAVWYAPCGSGIQALNIS